MRRLVLPYVLALGATASALTVEGREIRMAAGGIVAEDAQWLDARARRLVDEGEYGRANDIATLLAAAAPADMKLAAQALAARTKYFAVGHKESYVAFRDLYKAELTRRGEPPAPATEDDLARLKVISTEAVAAAGTAYGAKAVSATKRISSYDSPTANTGVADAQPSRYDLRWSVNLLFLIREYDKANLDAAKKAIKGALEETRTYGALFRDCSMPKSTQARALDEVRGSVASHAQKMLPPAIAREIVATYNLEGFKLCIQKPVDVPELTLYVMRVMKVTEPEYGVEQYVDEGYAAFRGTATVRATAKASLADVLTYYGCDPYVWRPFVGDLEKKEETKKDETGEPPPTPEEMSEMGGIPEGP